MWSRSSRSTVLIVATALLALVVRLVLAQAPGAAGAPTVNARAATPTITLLNPSTGSVGASVTMTGSGFNGSQGSGVVTFNGVTATVTSWSPTSLTTTVPSGATTGNVVIIQNGITSAGVSFTVTGGGGGASIIAAARQAGGGTAVPNPVWANSGVTGGIPTISTQCGSTIAAPSSSAAINAAIQACASGFVSLAAGTFNIGAGGIVMKSNVVLRGQGMATILNMTGDVGGTHWYWGGGSCSLVFTGGYLSGAIDHGVPPVAGVTASTTWTGTDGVTNVFTQGSTVVNVGSAAGFVVGDMIVLWQADPSDASVPNSGLFFSDKASGAGSIAWQGSYDDDNSAVEERSRITAINGTAITIADPIAHPSYLWQTSLGPRAGRIAQANLIHDAGLENLRITSVSAGRHQCDIGMAWGYNLWVRGVGMVPKIGTFHGSNSIDFAFIAEDSLHVSFVNSWIDPMLGGGIDTTTSYGVAFKQTHYFRVENNIFNNVESPSELLIGSMGGVFGYNYERFVGDNGQEGGLQQHEVGSSMDLAEGNSYYKVFMDLFHGNSGVSTYFRNHLQDRGFDIQANHRCHNLIGNVIDAATVRKTLYSDAMKYDRWSDYAFRFGYASQNPIGTGEPGFTGFVNPDARINETTMVWGNYAPIGGTVFNAAEVPSSDATCPNPVPADQVLPNSFYLSARPPFFTVSGIGTLPWPLIGPDVTGGTVTGLAGHANKTPAQRMYEATAGGLIANFNPGLYGS